MNIVAFIVAPDIPLNATLITRARNLHAKYLETSLNRQIYTLRRRIPKARNRKKNSFILAGKCYIILTDNCVCTYRKR